MSMEAKKKKKKKKKSKSLCLRRCVPALAELMPLGQELVLLTVQHPGEKPMMRKTMVAVMTEAALFK